MSTPIPLVELYTSMLLDTFRASADVAAFAPAAITDSLGDVIDIGDALGIAVHEGAEVPRDEVYGLTDRFAELLVTVVVRDPRPDVLSRRVLAALFPLVMNLDADRLIEIKAGTISAPVYNQADVRVAMRTAHFVFHYRASQDSLTG
jgi:hypothetical protein